VTQEKLAEVKRLSVQIEAMSPRRARAAAVLGQAAPKG